MDWDPKFPSFPEGNVSSDVVWKNGIQVGEDPGVWRQDACGAWINYHEYKNRGSQFGWEKDHIWPKKYGGSNDLFNLRPFQWKNNVEKGSRETRCRVVADLTSHRKKNKWLW